MGEDRRSSNVASQTAFAKFLVNSYFVVPSRNAFLKSYSSDDVSVDSIQWLCEDVSDRVGHLCHSYNIIGPSRVQKGPIYRLLRKPRLLIAMVGVLTQYVIWLESGVHISVEKFCEWVSIAVNSQCDISQVWPKAAHQVRLILGSAFCREEPSFFFRGGTICRCLYSISKEQERYSSSFLFSSFRQCYCNLCQLFGSSCNLDECSTMYKRLLQECHVQCEEILRGTRGPLNFHSKEGILSSSSSDIVGAAFFTRSKLLFDDLFMNFTLTKRIVTNSSEILEKLFLDSVSFFHFRTCSRKRVAWIFDEAYSRQMPTSCDFVDESHFVNVTNSSYFSQRTSTSETMFGEPAHEMIMVPQAPQNFPLFTECNFRCLQNRSILAAFRESLENTSKIPIHVGIQSADICNAERRIVLSEQNEQCNGEFAISDHENDLDGYLDNVTERKKKQEIFDQRFKRIRR